MGVKTTSPILCRNDCLDELRHVLGGGVEIDKAGIQKRAAITVGSFEWNGFPLTPTMTEARSDFLLQTVGHLQR